ncbi:hypothetical protein SODALDRAFT_375037 [Sodiomyces alkalinus F11]|uniref:DUF7137 domain-containing protein n=1 Tax=Sodiomyces alkalinus (strain CBS 110278 / VKM F-3762 / F11) TaxID=1314773 RepID=A0A3N2Q810_SODAK|nr:hypothetical protein SODALDRAFT_375037 [Sodiomyces alkalinus F11]ROT42775.1 hypothetical protein SODALDRAFT_375037 [Sodiomyces alkalinus F11]
MCCDDLAFPLARPHPLPSPAPQGRKLSTSYTVPTEPELEPPDKLLNLTPSVMKPTTTLAVCLAALTPLASAWPNWLPDVDALVVRQDNDESAAPSATPEPSAEESPSPSGNEEDDAESTVGTTTTGRRVTDLNTARIPSATPSGSGSPSGSDSDDRTTTTEFDPTLPAGNVVMLTPAPTDPGPKLYKIGDYVTFGWNYTDLRATPTAVDVLVSCARATATWTLTQNMTFSTKGEYTWDSREQATAVQSPLLTEEYTLIIYDADSEITATARPGYLSVFDQFKFDMYEPRPYTPLADWNCPTCSAAVPSIDRKALGFALTMSVVTVLSFTWFVTGIL